MQKHKYQAYATATQTVARTRQVVMLYDGIIRFLQQARDAIINKRIEDRYNLLIKASAIVSGLQLCLDFENGGEIAKVLYSFYANVDSRIFSIHRTNSLQTCDEVIDDVKKMRDVWHEIDQGSNADTGGESKVVAAAAAVVAPAVPVASVTPVLPDSQENVTLSA